MKKTSTRKGSKTRRPKSAAASSKTARIASAPADRFSVSEKDASGKVTITDRRTGGTFAVAANMANFVVNAAKALASKGAASKASAAKPGASGSKAQASGAAAATTAGSQVTGSKASGSKASGSKAAAATGAKGGGTKSGKAVKTAAPQGGGAQAGAATSGSKVSGSKASGSKASGSKASGAQTATAVKPASTQAAGTETSAAPAAGKAAKTTAAKKTVAKKAVAKKAAAKAAPKAPAASDAARTVPARSAPPTAPEAPEARRRVGRPSNAELAGQPVTYPPQSSNKYPDQVRGYPKRFDSLKEETPKAAMERTFFEDHKKWGYDVTIAGRSVGQLLFDHDGVWKLAPTDARLLEKAIKATVHANPVAAFVRVKGGWRRVISGEADQPVAAPAPAATEAA